MDESHDSWFNLESCTDSAELECQILSEAIEGTLYAKRWVISAIMKLVDTKDAVDLSDDEEANLASLVDMSIEPESCRFLSQISALDLLASHIVQNPECQRSHELILCLWANCFHVSDLAASLLGGDSKLLLIALHILNESSSAQVLTSAFVFLNSFLAQTIRLERIAELIKFLEPEFVHRLAFLLASSTSSELLLEMSRFLLQLLDFCAVKLDDFQGGAEYCSPTFVQCVTEALQQVCRNASLANAFLEILGSIVTTDNLRGIHPSVLATVVLYAQSHSEMNTETLGSLCKITSLCWEHEAHQESHEIMSQIRASLAPTSQDQPHGGSVSRVISDMLEKYAQKYIHNQS